LLKIKEKGDLSNQRDKLHRVKGKISDANTPENIKQRKEIGAQIAALTNEIESCRLIINKFQKEGVVDLTLQVKQKQEKPEEKKLDIKSMSGIEIMKKINSLNPIISKANKKLKDMPDGPKKQKLIKKIEADNTLLQQLKDAAK
jgi:N-methylhydantoinase B/oxoprolinase/acetone carboxylase alpha subunit